MTAAEIPLSSPPSNRQRPERGPHHRVESSNELQKRYSQGEIPGVAHLHTARKTAGEQLALNFLPYIEGEDSRGGSPHIPHASVSCESSVQKACLGLLRDATDLITEALLLKRSISRDEDVRSSKPPYHSASREHAKMPGSRNHYTPKLSRSTETQSLDTDFGDHKLPNTSGARGSTLLSDILRASVVRQIQRIEDILSNDSSEVQRVIPNAHAAFIEEWIEKEKPPPVEPTADVYESSVTGITRTAAKVYPAMPVVDQTDATADCCLTCSSDRAERKRPIIQAAVSPKPSGDFARVMVMIDSGSPWSLIAEETVLQNECLKIAYQKNIRPENAPSKIDVAGRTLKVLGHLSRLVLSHKKQLYEVKKVLVLEAGVFQHSNFIVGSESMMDGEELGEIMVKMLKPVILGANESRQEA